MLYSGTYPKRYHLIALPQPHTRFNSLKPSHSQLHNPPTLTKRHSLDSRPTHHNQKKQHSFLENVEESCPGPKYEKLKTAKQHKISNQDNLRLKYYWRGKHGKSSKKEEKSKVKKVKRTWSELGKNCPERERQKYASRSKCEDTSKVNTSDRLETRHEATHGKSCKSQQPKKDPFSGERAKLANSLLNSTMLTKRESEESKRKEEQSMYQEIIAKLREILSKYQKRVRQLKQQKEGYRLKLKKERRRRLEFS